MNDVVLVSLLLILNIFQEFIVAFRQVHVCWAITGLMRRYFTSSFFSIIMNSCGQASWGIRNKVRKAESIITWNMNYFVLILILNVTG